MAVMRGLVNMRFPLNELVDIEEMEQTMLTIVRTQNKKILVKIEELLEFGCFDDWKGATSFLGNKEIRLFGFIRNDRNSNI